jgi:hypothetical protein
MNSRERFVSECRQEWRRLGVGDAVANEMAAELAADLEEAAAEGISAPEVLGQAAFDPRAFASTWATERGVTRPHPTRSRLLARPTKLVAVVALLVGIAGAGLAMLSYQSGATAAGSGQLGLVPSGNLGLALHTLGAILVSIVVPGAATVLLWSSWARFGRVPLWASLQRSATPGEGDCSGAA